MYRRVSFGGNFRKFPRMSLQILFAGCVCGAHAQLCQRENQSKLERHRGTSGMRIRTRARAIEFRFCVLAPVGQIFRNNVTYTTVDHVARWIKEGSWLPAIRAFNLAHEPFGSRLPPRTCPALYP